MSVPPSGNPLLGGTRDDELPHGGNVPPEPESRGALPIIGYVERPRANSSHRTVYVSPGLAVMTDSPIVDARGAESVLLRAASPGRTMLGCSVLRGYQAVYTNS